MSHADHDQTPEQWWESPDVAVSRFPEAELVAFITDADIQLLQMAARRGVRYLDYDPTDD